MACAFCEGTGKVHKYVLTDVWCKLMDGMSSDINQPYGAELFGVSLG